MSLDPTLDAVRAANSAFLARLEDCTPADHAQPRPGLLSIVVACAYIDESWAVYLSDDLDTLCDESTPYVSPVPVSVRTRGELIEYMKSEKWNEILFSIYQDFEGVRNHKPD